MRRSKTRFANAGACRNPGAGDEELGTLEDWLAPLSPCMICVLEFARRRRPAGEKPRRRVAYAACDRECYELALETGAISAG